MMKNTKPRKVHFMGVGGSATSGITFLAKKEGYEVDGCDLEKDNPYLTKLRKIGVKVFYGHASNHIDNADLVVTTPAVLLQNKNHPEVRIAIGKKILITVQKFLGEYLHENKEVVCIAGTHGKSTTTSLVGLIFASAKIDPSVMVGGTVDKWGGNFRYGKGKVFVTEADEFYDNYLNYKPQAIILNNVEWDHPDYFKDFDDVIASFMKFIKNLAGKNILVVNQDSMGVKKVFRKLGSKFLNSINVYGYTFKGNPLLHLPKSVKINIKKKDEVETIFSLKSEAIDLNTTYNLSIPGEYNVANAAGVIILAKLYNIPDEDVKKVLKKFRGIGRRLELIGERKGVKVYDDYAHHPTAIRETLSALRQKFPKQRIIVVDEAHSYSRTFALLADYNGAFNSADKVIIGPIFKARDKKTFGVDGASIVNRSNHKDISYIETPEKISKYIKSIVRSGDVIIIMGAGYSYKWARDIFDSL